MLAEKSDLTQDHQIIDYITINNLCEESIESYRKRFLFTRGTSHPWASLSNEDFLYQLGCATKIPNSSQYKLTLAGLLMFGYEREITEILQNYFLDYREKDETLSNERWSHRIISSDGSWSGNLYDFYFKIINRLTSDLAVPFKLNNSIRSDNTPIHDAIREALTNTLIHTDFRESGSILIEKTNNTFIFTNPGNLRIPKERALKGGESDPRNPILHKAFSLIGLGERAGSGLLTIQETWKKQYWQRPELNELVQPDKVQLILKTISLIPINITNLIKQSIPEELYKSLSENEILSLAIAAQYSYVTNIKLQDYADINAYESNKVLNLLLSKNLLIATGTGRGKKYILSKIFEKNISNVNSGSLDINSGSLDINSGSLEEYLLEISKPARTKKRLSYDEMSDIIIKMCNIKNITLIEFSKYLNRDESWIRKKYLNSLIKSNKIQLLYPQKPNHPAQAYCKK